MITYPKNKEISVYYLDWVVNGFCGLNEYSGRDLSEYPDYKTMCFMGGEL